MSDQIESVAGSDSDDEDVGLLAGERLAQARREQEIPLLDIAKELHLDEHKVRALETNDFDVIGAPVFAKGHLRKYAQLVNVDEADVMSDYYQLERSSGMPLVVTPRPKIRREGSSGPWILTIALILLLIAGYWWFAIREDAAILSVSDATVSSPAVDMMGDLETSSASSELLADAGNVENGVSTPASEADVEPEAPQQQRQAQPALTTVQSALAQQVENGETNLSVQFSGDCWTEITDASGARLFFGLGKAGQTVDLSGQGPLIALFGNANYVKITVNRAPYQISDLDRSGRTAKLTIDGS